MKDPQSIHHAVDRALEATPAIGTSALWLADAETIVVIIAGLCTAAYYGISAWVKWRNRNDGRP